MHILRLMLYMLFNTILHCIQNTQIRIFIFKNKTKQELILKIEKVIYSNFIITQLKTFQMIQFFKSLLGFLKVLNTKFYL